MVEHGYVKKRKRKKFVAVLSGVATLGMGSLVLVSFLGRYAGNFTVSLNTGNVKLSLSDKENFTDASTYLKVDDLGAFDQMTYTRLPSADIIDNEESSYLIGKNSSNTMNFFKYTFFVKNMGSVSADYTLSVRIVESIPSQDGRYLDSTLRVMLYANDGYDKDAHEHTVYAKASESPNIDTNGQQTLQEYISYSPKQAKSAGVEFPGFCTNFESENVIATIPVRYFDQSNMNRYTIVTWIEGYDPQASGDEAPEGANIKLGVEINANENE